MISTVSLPVILTVANLIFTSAMFGIIWLVQIVHYPMFEGLNESDFIKWHVFHSFRITFIVAPLMFGELGLSVWLAWMRRDAIGSVLVALTIALWLSTFLVSVPIHQALGRSEKRTAARALIRSLVATNWIRTTLYTAKLAVLVWLFLSVA